ncbi:MAG: antibiotic biosynthesis monooxygenase family protein [Herbiconiux sp.]|nr:antibiotic biosynthesis monooxygenase family protein [Herbiconiux sp.]
MTVIAVLELRVKAEALADAPAIIQGTLEVTRSRPGSLGVDITVDVDDPTHYLIVERWEDLAADDAYRAFRASPEGASELRTIVAEPPVLTRTELRAQL